MTGVSCRPLRIEFDTVSPVAAHFFPAKTRRRKQSKKKHPIWELPLDAMAYRRYRLNGTHVSFSGCPNPNIEGQERLQGLQEGCQACDVVGDLSMGLPGSHAATRSGKGLDVLSSRWSSWRGHLPWVVSHGPSRGSGAMLVKRMHWSKQVYIGEFTGIFALSPWEVG